MNTRAGTLRSFDQEGMGDAQPAVLAEEPVVINFSPLGRAIAASASGGYVPFHVDFYGAVGDGTTDDTAAIQAAIDDAATASGTVRLGSKTYRITSALVISAGMIFEGSGVVSLMGGRAEYGSDVLPIVSPYLDGSVLLMATAATDALHVTAVGQPVTLRNFGIRFADAIRFTDTGHGVVCDPGAYLTVKNNGICGGDWSSVYVYGHDGDHYAFVFFNAYYVNFSDLQGYGGGGIKFYVDAGAGFYGNCTFTSPYFLTLLEGTAHGFYIDSTGGAGLPIYLCFIRPQSFFLGGTVGGVVYSGPIVGQYNFYCGDPVVRLVVLAGDMETAGTVANAGGTRINRTGMEDGSFIQMAGVNGPKTGTTATDNGLLMSSSIHAELAGVAKYLGFFEVGDIVAFVHRNPSGSGGVMYVGQATAHPLHLRTTNLDRVIIKADGTINIPTIPTSASGLASGDLWSNSGVLTRVT